MEKWALKYADGSFYNQRFVPDMSRRRKIVLVAYILTVLLGTLPYAVKCCWVPRGPAVEWVEWIAALLAVPTIPLQFAVFPVGGLVFKMEDEALNLLMLVLTPIYLACLFWPMPTFAFALHKCTWPPTGRVSKPYSVALMSGIALGACLTVMVEVAPFWQGKEARRVAAETQLESFKTALDAFKTDSGRLPSTAEGLTALTARPVSVPSNSWRGPYLNDVPKDPWGHDYVYRCPGLRGKSGFDIYSCGPDGQSKSGGDDSDDINNWSPTR